MKRRWAWLTAGFAVVVLAGVGAAAVEQSQARAENHTVRVGIVYSRTGLLSAYGAQYIQGLRLGLSYLTKGTNRVNGHKIEITAVDDGTDPAKAVSAVRGFDRPGLQNHRREHIVRRRASGRAACGAES